MNLPSILGFMGTLLGLVRAVPQLVRLVRARQAFGVSVDTTLTSSIVSFGWAVYGVLTGQVFVTLATGSSGVIFAIVTLLALRYGRKLREFKIAPLWLAVLLLAGLVFGKSGLGAALSAPWYPTCPRSGSLTGKATWPACRSAPGCYPCRTAWCGASTLCCKATSPSWPMASFRSARAPSSSP
jgi:uncharacterized protein with PQ loop repeat